MVVSEKKLFLRSISFLESGAYKIKLVVVVVVMVVG